MSKPEPIPTEIGYYWATFQYVDPRHGTTHSQPWRTVVRIGKNGFGHTRVFLSSGVKGMDFEHFTQWSKRLVDPAEKGKRA